MYTGTSFANYVSAQNLDIEDCLIPERIIMIQVAQYFAHAIKEISQWLSLNMIVKTV